MATDTKTTWEKNESLKLLRLPVPGGWLVQPMYGGGLAFVPDTSVSDDGERIRADYLEDWEW